MCSGGVLWRAALAGCSGGALVGGSAPAAGLTFLTRLLGCSFIEEAYVKNPARLTGPEVLWRGALVGCSAPATLAGTAAAWG